MHWDPHAGLHWSPQNPCNLQEYKIKYCIDPDMHLLVRSRRSARFPGRISAWMNGVEILHKNAEKGLTGSMEKRSIKQASKQASKQLTLGAEI